ncbi:UNVERIFIED_CONTAM: Glucan endo-1,3-beta-glucosidase 8 [Sesamum radiatum]|uniref:Glucan endo-1,3-beta-glucosidase 8 n=1 Tax=Sesamum radiatum TaxID=300843 RepID=A0AAW2N9Z0_SESRA
MNLSLAYIILVLYSTTFVADAAIGINWGRQTAQKLVPSMVVDLILQNGIKHARVYSTQKDILEAFVGSGIDLSISIFGYPEVRTPETAKKWLQARTKFFDSCNISRVYIGNYVFKDGITNKTKLNMSMMALESVQNALNEAGYGRVKVTLPCPEGVLINITRPSEAEFRPEIKVEMVSTLRFLQANNAPFVVEIFPISHVIDNGWDVSFAFPDNKSTHVVTDINGAVYTNVFEFMHDAFAWALRKAGAPDIKIVVGQVGWPTDGYPGANVSTAERFYKHLLPYVVSNKGTPMRPGTPIDTYVHALTDENKMPFFHPFARHWGIYASNGEPKYKIDLTGQGRDIFPPKVKGIMRMPQRWCVFNGNLTDIVRVKNHFYFACTEADCTSLAYGGSCSRLNFVQNISFAFNMYFQSQFQSEDACQFNDLGKVTTEDPSTGTCIFPVEVVKGEIYESADGSRLGVEMPIPTIFLFFLSVLWTLFWD